MKKLIYSLCILTAAISLSSCESIIETDTPSNQLVEEDALTSKADVQELLQSCYDVNANLWDGDVQNLNELLADNLELQNNSGDWSQVYNHNVSIFNGTTSGIYGEPYITTFRANRILDVLDDFFNAEEAEKLEAEVRFLRALSHFQVVRLWSQPFGYTAENTHPGIIYKENTEVEVIPRPTVASNYQDILADLEFVEETAVLPQHSQYSASMDALYALLSEVHFQMGNYREAADYATQVIASNRYELDTIINRFQPDTVIVPEVIFGTRSYSITGINDYRTGSFTSNYRSDQNAEPFFRANYDNFYLEYSQDSTDRRINELYELREEDNPNRYVAVTKFNKSYFDVPIFYLTKLMLIRAESLALLNEDLATAISDINDIRARAYTTDQSIAQSASATVVLDAVRYERRIELFGEGDRAQDLKRRGAIEGENIIIRGDEWDCPGMIIQFPATERTELFELNPQGGC